MIRREGEERELMPGAVQFLVLGAGEGDRPEVGDIVSYDCVSKLPCGAVFAEREGALLCLGDSDVVPALELGVRHMNSGCRARVRSVHRFAYGSQGREPDEAGGVAVPPGSDVIFEVRLHSIMRAKDEGVLKHALQRKKIGNEHFMVGNYNRAINSYQKVIKAIDADDFGEEGRQLLIDCGNNLSISCQKEGNLGGAIDAATAVLTLDPMNLKALYRAAVVSVLQDKFNVAEVAIAKAKEVYTAENKTVVAAERQLNERKRRYAAKSKILQEKMARSLVEPWEGAGQTGQRGVSEDEETTQTPPPAGGGDGAAAVTSSNKGREEDHMNTDVGDMPVSGEEESDALLHPGSPSGVTPAATVEGTESLVDSQPPMWRHFLWLALISALVAFSLGPKFPGASTISESMEGYGNV